MEGDQYMNDKSEGDLHFCKNCKKGKRSGEDWPLCYPKTQYFVLKKNDIEMGESLTQYMV
jgi:hypothetical protein